jgi:hypothetical protein
VKFRSCTVDDAWLELPAPDVVDVIGPVLRSPGTTPIGVVAMCDPPVGERGHVSATVVVVGWPPIVTVEFTPVARPL